MVWAAFSHDHQTPLYFFNGPINVATYQQVLQTNLVPLLQQHPRLQTFQQDNARPSTSSRVDQDAASILPEACSIHATSLPSLHQRKRRSYSILAFIPEARD